jgi:hypothetical protein
MATETMRQGHDRLDFTLQRDDWLRNGVLSGFLATCAMTVVVAGAYFFSLAIGDEDGSRLERWFWALSHNPVTNTTEDRVVLAIGLNLVMGLALALVYARIAEPMLSGAPWRKGILFAMIPFVLSVIAFLPMMGGGLLGSEIEAGPLPVLGNFVLHLIYGGVLGAVYGLALEDDLDDTESDRANAASAERGAAIGVALGLAVGALAGWAIGPELADLGSRTSTTIGGAMIGGAMGVMAGSLLGLGRVQHLS